MSYRRSLPWSAALRDLKGSRAARPAIREERLRSTAGLRGTPAVTLSAWRGRSGKRYVVQILPLDADAPERAAEGVALIVQRDAAGIARIVAIAGEMSRAAWWRRAAEAGGTELHLHRLAESAHELAAIADDLTE